MIEEFRADALAAGIAQNKIDVEPIELPEDIVADVEATAHDELKEALQIVNKQARDEAVSAVKDKAVEALIEKYPEQEEDLRAALEAMMKQIVRKLITLEHKRPDGRAITEVRPAHLRSRSSATRPRQRRLHPWSDADHERHHPRFPA